MFVRIVLSWQGKANGNKKYSPLRKSYIVGEDLRVGNHIIEE